MGDDVPALRPWWTTASARERLEAIETQLTELEAQLERQHHALSQVYLILEALVGMSDDVEKDLTALKAKT